MSKINEIIMPSLGGESEEVYIAEWNVKSGDKIFKGQLIAVLELDKTTIELKSNFDGYIFIINEEKDVRSPGDIVAVITSNNDASILDKYR